MKIASYLALFFAVVFSGDRLVGFLAMKAIQHSRNQFVKMYEGKHPADILFLGDSRVDRNFSFGKVREMTGRVCLNLGLGGNNMLISEALLKDYVQRYGNPKLVVIELGHSTVEPNTMGEMRIFSYCSTNIRALARSVDPTFAAFESVFTSLRFNDPAFWRLTTEVFCEPSSRLLNNTIPPEILDKWQGGRCVQRPIIGQNMEALRRMCDYADARNMEIRLLIGPCWREFKKGIVNYQLWKAALQKAAGEHRIYDYSEVFFDHADYFNDEMHLNAVGADCFVQRLVEDKTL